MNEKEFLSIGSIVLLKNATKRIMVTGYLPITKDNKIYDYVGCLYPEGLIDSEKNLLFNHDQIKEVFFEGFSDNETITFKEKIVELANNEKKNLGYNQDSGEAAIVSIEPEQLS